MWTMVVAAALAAGPAEAGGLKLTNVRTTCGVLGPARGAHAVIPGCAYSIAYDIEGVTVAPDGRVRYSTAVEVADARGKVLYKQMPRELEAVAALGGDQVPGFTHLDVGLDQPPGEYTLRLTVTDLASGKSATLSRKVTVKPPAFGLVRVTATHDRDGDSPATALAAGQSLWVGAGVVGFARNKETGHPHIRVSLRVLDEDGKPTLARPFVGELGKDVAASALSVPVQFYLLLNRPGKFTVELTATDLIANKTDKSVFPLTVHPAR